jgi:hypothetical protein
MANVQLRAGANIDILSPKEHKEQLQKVVADFEAHMQQVEGETIIHSSSFPVDGSGGTSTGPYNGYGVYRVPVGFDAFLTRIAFDFEGSSAKSTVSVDVRVCADQNTPSALRAIYNVVPAVFEASKSHAPYFGGGSVIVVSMQGMTASTTMYVNTQLILTRRLALDHDVLHSDGE